MIFENAIYLANAAETAGDEVSSFGEACAVAGFTIAVVFGVLCLIFVCLKIVTAIITAVEKATKKAAASKAVVPADSETVDAGEDFSSGSLKLKDCDEKTAAMIMAIVSDNTGIPLSELVFKSITLIEK